MESEDLEEENKVKNIVMSQENKDKVAKRFSQDLNRKVKEVLTPRITQV